MKCDFRNIESTKKVLFKSKLSGEPIHFGFIPVWELRAFVKFCLENRLVKKLDPSNPRNPWYIADVNFLYTSTYSLASFYPGARLMTWIADLLRIQLPTGGLRPLRTALQTIDCGPDHNASHYVIRNNMYIS